MNVGIVTSVNLPPREGIGHYVVNLGRHLTTRGHGAVVLTRGSGLHTERLHVEGLDVYRLPYLPTYPFHVHLHGLFVQKLVRQLEGEIDVFHLHTPLPPPLRTQRPQLLTVHSMMMVDNRARRTESALDLLNKLQAPVSAQIERQLFCTCGGITTVSQAAARDMQPLLQETGKSVEVTWNGVDTAFFSPDRHEVPEPDSLLFVGRLAPGKGLADLVAAMSQLAQQAPHVRLRIAGDGPLRKKLELLIARSGLQEHMELLGHVSSRERLRDLYRRAWALLMPSHHESMPTVVLEAMACGTAIVSTRVGSVPDFVVDGGNGLLIPPRAPESMAQAIGKLQCDPALRARLGAAARRTVQDHFSWQAVGATYLRCYRMLLEDANRRGSSRFSSCGSLPDRGGITRG